MILSNVGLSSRWSAIYSPNNGPHAAAIRVQLRSGFAGRRTSTPEYVNRLRQRLAEEFPSTDFFFETGGMIRQVLNAGAVAPIEVQVRGRDNEVRRDFARRLNSRLAKLPHIQDTYLPQGMDLPQLIIQVDRDRAAQQFGFTELDVMRSVFTALMSSAKSRPISGSTGKAATTISLACSIRKTKCERSARWRTFRFRRIAIARARAMSAN